MLDGLRRHLCELMMLTASAEGVRAHKIQYPDTAHMTEHICLT